MKIDGYELFIVEPRWMLLRVSTDVGIVGWGEPIVEGRAEPVKAAVEILFEELIGKDPRRIEDHWQWMTKGGFYRGGPVLSSAVSGIDQALWDITGRALGVGIHELLGGAVRDRVRMYTWVHGDTTTELAADAAAKAAAGFTALKFNLTGRTNPLLTSGELANAVARMAALRAAVGPDVDIAIDLHGRFSTAAAVQTLHLLEPYNPIFAEEPVLPEHTANLGRVVASTKIPIATGERLFSRREFEPAFAAGIAVAQPDLSHAGGISECRRIATAAETHDVLLAPHCPLGPVALAACLQVDLVSANFLLQEQSLGLGYTATGPSMLDYLANPEVFEIVDGYMPRLTGPGLGIEVNEQAVRAAATHTWRPPRWTHPDNSLAEW